MGTGQCFPLFYVSSSFGWVHHVSNVLPFLIRSFVFFLSGLFSLWLPYPGVNPVASIVTLLYSFRLTQTSTSRTVLICVVCLRFCFPHYSSLCLPDGLKFFCHGPFLVLLRVPMVRLCCLLSLGSYSWLKFYYRLH